MRCHAQQKWRVGAGEAVSKLGIGRKPVDTGHSLRESKPHHFSSFHHCLVTCMRCSWGMCQCPLPHLTFLVPCSSWAESGGLQGWFIMNVLWSNTAGRGWRTSCLLARLCQYIVWFDWWAFIVSWSKATTLELTERVAYHFKRPLGQWSSRINPKGVYCSWNISPRSKGNQTRDDTLILFSGANTATCLTWGLLAAVTQKTLGHSCLIKHASLIMMLFVQSSREPRYKVHLLKALQ